jgi:hypothetical protein
MTTKHLVIAFSLTTYAVALSSYVSAQRLPEASDQKTTRIEMPLPKGIAISALNQTSVEIRKIRPDIPSETLNADAEIIQSTLPNITAEFTKIGLTFDDAVWASQRAWKKARLESPLRLNPDKTIDRDSFVDYVTTDMSAKIVRWQIKSENPDISPVILTRDLQLIEQAQPDIVARYEKIGWTATEARAASLFAWRRARLDSPLKSFETIDRESLVASATEIAIMVFTSEPDEADVYINSVKIGTTNKQKNEPVRFFVDGQRISARFVKNDFVPQDLNCVARGSDTVICKAELKHQQ